MELEADCGFFKKYFNNFKDLFETICLEFSKKSITLSALDNAHICVAQSTLDTSKFDSYKCENDINLCVSTCSIIKILGCCPPKNKLKFVYKKDSNMLDIFSVGKVKRKYKMKLLDDDDSTNVIPNVEYEESICMDSPDFSSLVKELNKFGDDLSLKLNKTGIKFTSNGDGDSAEYEIEHKFENTVEQSFSLKYLLMIIRSCNLSNEIEIDLSNQYPLKCSFKFDLGELCYYLAPKIFD